MSDRIDQLLALVAKRQAENQRKKCSGCRVESADALLIQLCRRIAKDAEKFRGLTMRDVWQWSGAAGAKLSESTWTKHVKHHRPEQWAVLASILRRAKA